MGRTRSVNKYDLNLIDEHGKYGIGYCSNTNNKFYFDMDDYDKIKDIYWYEKIRKNGFRRIAGTDRETGKQILMHVLLGFPWYDHTDRNELNNRKYNLRKASNQENARNHNKQSNNSSGFIGVCFSTTANKWMSYIMIDKKNIYLGYFINKEEAVKARLQAEAKYFKEFAPQRHLFKQHGILEDDFLDSKRDN